jgi:transcriptional accessory protein Tex/SPT6
MDDAILARIVKETALPESSVSAAVGLIEKGASAPFIVRYRREATGSLDIEKVGLIQERMDYYREIRDRRMSLLKSLSEQGKLTDEMKAKIEGCFTKVELDDLQQRFRSKKKTRLREAVARGLQPLAQYLLEQEPDAWSLEDRVKVFAAAGTDQKTRCAVAWTSSRNGSGRIMSIAGSCARCSRRTAMSFPASFPRRSIRKPNTPCTTKDGNR